MNNTSEINELMKDDWEKGNNVLYELCKVCPGHKNEGEIIAKIWLIGRAYAVAVERRIKNLNISNDRFYIEQVVPVLKKSSIDKMIADFKKKTNSSEEDCMLDILKIHKHLCEILNELTGHDKRSLSSKYLHFHEPDLFYIYDARVTSAINKCGFNVKLTHKDKEFITNNIDKKYATYFIKANRLKKSLEKQLGRMVTPREVDSYLINIASRKSN